jgi:hypothetical protein
LAFVGFFVISLKGKEQSLHPITDDQATLSTGRPRRVLRFVTKTLDPVSLIRGTTVDLLLTK